MNSDSLERRIATLEAEMKQSKENDSALKKDVRDLVDELKELRALATRGKGFFAGVAVVVVPLWTLAVAAATAVWDKVFGQ